MDTKKHLFLAERGGKRGHEAIKAGVEKEGGEEIRYLDAAGMPERAGVRGRGVRNTRFGFTIL